MAIIKCKMCGGDLNLVEGQSVAECEYCGSMQTVPAADDEKKLNLFARANRLRAACDFDKAAGIYESIASEFTEEAEAYWGLVLCKYGIEYVDDPATGKKIPTCHRSSFDSVMDDPDLDQALENADIVARKVYRDEAKAIEELRKGIIEVSGKEEPYDIFICYKETAENGERTLDSVLAQDIYDELTGKGYRVFFSRITLEDKLGQEYEPYIFAALNSAKVMLVFGTDYEYFNAVWVKNEWSRFLKLMAEDKSKHLIPCYKGIDAYDMPKEFAKLQAQDLGKVGATQDLLRGIEKLLPKAAPVTIVQERVVVGGPVDNKIASLLDRGNMALEDGDWAKADSFFEDVLNSDSKNSQAYLGKTLAQEKCRTIDAFIRKRKTATESVQGRKLSLAANHDHVGKMAQKCSVPGYVEHTQIKGMYNFDLSYFSTVAERKEQYRAEEKFWAEHKLLSRAEKFAVGAVAENLAAEKKALFAALSDRVKKAEADEAASIAELKKRYEKFLAETDEKVETLYKEASERREEDYRDYSDAAEETENISDLLALEKSFCSLQGYRDSTAQATRCREKATYLKAKKLITDACTEDQIDEAILLLNTCPDYLDSDELIASAKDVLRLKQQKFLTLISAYKGLLKPNLENNEENMLRQLTALLKTGKSKMEELLQFFPETVNKLEEVNLDICNRKGQIKTLQSDQAKLGLFEGKRKKEIGAKIAALQNELRALYLHQAEQAIEYIVSIITSEAYLPLAIKDSCATRIPEVIQASLFAVKAGDCITFGSYKQGNSTSNDEEKIEWLVLDVQDGKALVISKYALDCKPYNYSTMSGATWGYCTLRGWLNNDFINSAFSVGEQRIIVTTTVSADKNPCYNTDPGSPTQDKVFLLSITEANKYLSFKNLKCKPTIYAKARRVQVNSEGDCSWWLRSPGSSRRSAAAITSVNGEGIFESGFFLSLTDVAVRPALWIDLGQK